MTASTTARSATSAKPATSRTSTSTAPKATASPIVAEKPKPTLNFTVSELFGESETSTPTVSPIPEAPKEPDENSPRSKPKHENDQYIRKRMTIAGSSYCKAEVLVRLEAGRYFDLVAEPDNPYDKDAVKLIFEGEKIGYVPKADRLAFVTCLKLKRKIYGVITAIDATSLPARYEFEAWFDQEK